MLIELNFVLRGPGPTGCVYTPITGCFYGKTIISKENILMDCYLLLKYCRKQRTLFNLTWAKSSTKLNPKMQNFIRVLDLNCKQKED